MRFLNKNTTTVLETYGSMITVNAFGIKGEMEEYISIFGTL
jgi:hypothetical protein